MDERSPSGRPLQARAIQTRRDLLVAAAEVFDRGGYSAATMQDIVIEAGRTQGALYKHYQSKADIAEAIMREHLAQWEALIEESRGWGLDALHTLSQLIARVARSYQEDVIARAAVRIRDDYYDTLSGQLPHSYTVWLKYSTQMLKRGQKDGSIAPDLDCAAVAKVLVASFYGILDMSSRLKARRDLLDRVGEWWATLIPILTEAGVWAAARTVTEQRASAIA